MNLLTLLVLFWIAILVSLLAIPALRRRVISGPLLYRFRQVIPAVSDTEQVALEAGSVWWDAELFSGRPHWRRLLAMPRPALSTEEQAFLDGPVEALCRILDDWRITHEDQDLPPEVWAFLREQGFFGLIVPKSYGGREFSAFAHSAVVMKIASRSVAAAVTVMVPNSLGPAELLLHYGSARQKHHYLPRLARGAEIPCFALTGPRAGSDAGALPDTGIVCRAQWQGRETLGIRLNWEKRYITLAPVATVLGLAFRLHDPERLLGQTDVPGITLALIPTDTPGVRIGRRHIPLDIPFQNGPTEGKDVFIPLQWVIGERAGVGQGWRMLMESLAAGRGISLPALATGAGKTACRFTGAYARVRRQFGRPIGDFEGVQEALARMAGETYRMDAARRLTLAALDRGERPAVISAILKYHLTEGYRRVLNHAMDVQGGSGICLGPRNLLGRAYQAIPISITVEGANILTRGMIIFGQGAIRCHPFVLKEYRVAHDPERSRAVREFDQLILAHAGYLLRNLARTLLQGLARGRLTRPPLAGAGRRYLQRLDWMSTAFALSADLSLMTLGGSLKRRERLSARLGDILSHLYLASAVLKEFEDQGRPAADEPLLRWALEDSLHGIQEALIGLWRNLPSRPLGLLLRALVFPTGRPFPGPDDRLERQAARLLLAASDTRERLTEGIFQPSDPAFAGGRLEQALALSLQTEALERRLRQARKAGSIDAAERGEQIRQALARGIVDRQEAGLLGRAEALYEEVIRVDAFDAYGARAAQRNGTRDRRANAA